MYKLTLAEFMKIHRDYRDVWTSQTHPEYLGRRTCFEGSINPGKGTCLIIEGIHFIITDDPKYLTKDGPNKLYNKNKTSL